MSIVSGSPPAAPASMGGLSSAVEDLSVLPEMNSLRFDGINYLSRDMGGFSTTTYTLSMWIKRSKLGAIKIMGKADNPYVWHEFKSSDQYGVTDSGSGVATSVNYESSNLLRDTSGWYHLVTVYNIASSLDFKFYINGELATTSSLTGVYSNGSRLGGNYDTYIGRDRSAGVSGQNFEGYMANIQFIDGEALDSDSFGEWISDIWKPRPYTGNYGVNGFHLDFAGENMVYDSNGKLTQVLDASSNDNHWTAH